MCDPLRRKWVALLGLWISFYAAGCDADRARDDARHFLAAHVAIRYDASRADLEKRVDALEKLPLSHPSVRAVRDSCVGAHRSLLKEEAAQEALSARIDAALAQTPGGAPMDPAAIAKLQAGVTESEAALVRARDALKGCESQARDLDLRYGQR